MDRSILTYCGFEIESKRMGDVQEVQEILERGLEEVFVQKCYFLETAVACDAEIFKIYSLYWPNCLNNNHTFEQRYLITERLAIV